jgi:hypothetical protein
MKKLCARAWMPMIVFLTAARASAQSQAPELIERGLFVEGTVLAEMDASNAISRYGGGGEMGFPFRQELRWPPGQRDHWKPELSVRVRVDHVELTMGSTSVGVRVSPARFIQFELFAGVTAGFDSSGRAFGPSLGAGIPIVISRRLSVVPRASSWFAFAGHETFGLINIAGIGLRWQFY